MILKVDPDKVMRFIEDNFGLVRGLFRAQLSENVVPQETFDRLTRSTSDVVVNRLFEYKILVGRYEGIRINEPVRAFLAYLLNEFKPLLPEELEKYRISFEELYARIGRYREEDYLILIERLDGLYDEVQRFLENIEYGAGQLLKATQQLKANKDNMEYRQRIRRARHLIEHYIVPLNRILDVQQEGSITNILTEISRFVNRERFRHPYQTVRDRYSQLHDLMRLAEKRVLRQSYVISRELLPLIERLQTESEILTGWLHFLERPFREEVPDFPSRLYLSLTGQNIEAAATMFLQQFADRPEAVVLPAATGNTDDAGSYFFDRQRYRRLLIEALPLDDYFGWCQKVLLRFEKEPTAEHFLKVCSLAFENDSPFAIQFSAERVQLKVQELIVDAPKVAVAKPAAARPAKAASNLDQ